MKIIYTFLLFFIIGIISENAFTQNIYNIAGGVSNGQKIKNAYMSLRAIMTVDKDNNIIASATDYTMNSIRKYDYKNNIVQTIAGNDTYGHFIEGGKATETPIIFGALYQPSSVVMDNSGNIYFADIASIEGNTIRKISTTGYITTYAGSGARGYSGDGGAAALAKLNYPADLVFDKHGDMLIADTYNNCIRKVDKNGIIYTYAGTGIAGYNGDGIPAKEAQLNHPSSLAVDKTGNIYINDNSNGRIRKIDTNGVISTYFKRAKNDYYLGDIAIDSNYNVYAAEDFNVDKVVGPDSLQQILPRETVTEVQCLAVDRNNDILVSDDYSMRKILKDGTVKYLFGVASTPSFADSTYASEVTIGVGYQSHLPLAYNNLNRKLYVGSDRQIYKLDSAKNLLFLIGGNGAYGSSGDGGDAKKASFTLADFFINRKQNVVLSDNAFNNVREIDTTGIIKTIAGKGRGFSGDGGPALNARFNNPVGITEDSKGNIFIADEDNNRIRRIDAVTNIITTYAGTGEAGYSGDGGFAINAELNEPEDLAIDKKDNLYITDTKNHAIRKIDASGIITSISKKTDFKDIAVDKYNNLYYTNGSLIFKIDSAGNIIQVAGSTVDIQSVDGSPALQTSLFGANSFTIDDADNIFIQTLYNIKKLSGACFNMHIADTTSLVYKYVNKPELIYAECNVICKIAPKGNINDMLNSIVQSQVVVKRSAIKYNNNVFVRRYYNLTHELKLKTCKSKPTIFFTKEDFKNFNLYKGNQNSLPENDTDIAAIKNIRLVQVFDSSNDYKLINPSDNDILWNDSLNCWQISFDAVGLGSFYLTTNTSLISSNELFQIQSYHSAKATITPNPANKNINLGIDASLINTNAVITDINGKQLQIVKLTSTLNQINIGTFANGIYLIKLINGSVFKFIKQ